MLSCWKQISDTARGRTLVIYWKLIINKKMTKKKTAAICVCKHGKIEEKYIIRGQTKEKLGQKFN